MESEPEESHSSESAGSLISEQEEGSYSSESEGSHSSESEGNDGYYSSHDSGANQSVRGDDDEDDGDEEISSRKDGISELSDSILIRILSFLPMKYVVATSILSKRWQFLWTMVPNLVFRFRRRDEHFVNSIDKTLVLHQNSQIKKFLIDFTYQSQFQSSVNVWIRHATRKNVEELHLQFRVGQHIRSSPMDYAHALPQFLYANSSIVKLSLWFCNIKPTWVISWPSLKTLSIGSVELCDDLIEEILSGCPALESLELHHCFGINSLNITSASLKKLVINRYWDSSHSHHRSVLKISAPNVQSLGILGNMYTKECRVKNVPSLFDASLNFELAMQEGNPKDHYKLYHKVVMKLLKNVNHVKALTVGTWCIQVLSIFEGKDLSSLLSNLKCLILDTHLNKWDLPGIANLLQSSTPLETFVINMISPCSQQISVEVGFSFTDLHNFDEEKYWSSREGVLAISLINLKTVKIIGVIWNQPGIELVFGLVKFLLKNARMLEKVEICAKRDSQSRSRWSSLNSAQSLLSFPRASPNAVVLFS